VDGGVNVDNTGELVRAGADVLVSGSAFFGFPPFNERLAAFNAAAEQK
jgi:ribulose-phosphate 3-epimerase